MAQGGPVEGQLAQLGVHPHHLEDGLAPAVADVAAMGAADGTVDRGHLAIGLGDVDEAKQVVIGVRIGLLALVAQHPDQALGHHRLDRAGHQERLDPHVEQAGDRRRPVVGVKGREDQVPRQRGLHGDLRHLVVADLADEYHVRGLPQHRPQDRGEGQPDALADLALVDAGEVVLHRILGGDDLAVGTVEHVQGRVQGGGLARAGGPGHQEDAVGPADDLVEHLEVVRLEAEVHEADLDRLRPQDSQDDRLAVVGGAAAHAEVDRLPVHGHLDPAVLRNAPFGDVDAGHELDPRQQRGLHSFRQVVADVADAVDAVPQHDAIGHGLDVDVGRPLVNRLGDQPMHQADDRGFLPGADVDRRVDRAVHGHVDRLGDQRLLGEHPRRSLGAAVDERLDRALGGDGGVDLAVEPKPQQIEQLQVHRVVDHQLEPAVGLPQRQDQVLLDEVLRDQREVDLLLGLRPVEVDELHVKLGSQGLGDLLVATEGRLHQRLADPLAGPGSDPDRLLDLLLADRPPLPQDLAEFLSISRHLGFRARPARAKNTVNKLF